MNDTITTSDTSASRLTPRAFGARDLRELRETSGLSQEDFGRVIGMSRSSISRKEIGEWPLTLLERWALEGYVKRSSEEKY